MPRQGSTRAVPESQQRSPKTQHEKTQNRRSKSRAAMQGSPVWADAGPSSAVGYDRWCVLVGLASVTQANTTLYLLRSVEKLSCARDDDAVSRTLPTADYVMDARNRAETERNGAKRRGSGKGRNAKDNEKRKERCIRFRDSKRCWPMSSAATIRIEGKQ